MRTTRGKPTFDEVLLGDPDLARVLARAVAVEEVPDRFTHGFHTYPAGLNPDAARDLLAAFPSTSVLDPFCGGGTILVEARAAGRSAYGRDLSSVAVRVARARAASPSEEALTTFRSAARRLAKVAMSATDLPEEPVLSAIKEWYSPSAARELESLRRGIALEPEPARGMLEVVLSSILIKVSWRKSDTSPQRQRHHRPPGTTSTLFHKKARELARRQTALREVVPEGTPTADVALGDAREVRVERPVDLVLTSPPYPATYDYLLLQHLRRIWLGTIPGEREESEIGARRLWRDRSRQARRTWREDTERWTASAAAALAPGGHLVVVIGDGLTPQGPVDAGEVTEVAARAAGLKPVARASLERPDHARGRGRWEHVFAFRRG